MFSVITIIYNKETKGPTLMKFFTVTGKLKKFFFFGQLEMFDNVEISMQGRRKHNKYLII